MLFSKIISRLNIQKFKQMSINERALTFTLDLEDHRPDDSYPKRYPEITKKILDFLDARNIKATVFVLGRLADETPDLIKEIAEKGHEIAFHTLKHVHLTHESPEKFKNETEQYKKILEDLTGTEVVGFRAPAFSLTRKSVWALDILKELGFIYSSSVLPVANPINGFPGAPRKPFLWPNGLLEIPAPVTSCGSLSIPYLGGIYLRYLPVMAIKYFLSREKEQQALWIYCHPHDFDSESPYYTVKGTSRITSLLLWFNRKHTFRKIEKILSNNSESNLVSFIEQINSGRYKNVDTFILPSEMNKS
jgi:polysaccharide deacetylase family protein (PEP-CTERM system associated)